MTDLTDIRLAGLSEISVDVMIADLFSVAHASQIKSLSTIVYEQTAGNIFYIRQLLTYLREDKLLEFDETKMEWTWDKYGILQKIGAVDLMTARLNKLSTLTLEVLSVAAFLGSNIDEKLVNLIAHESFEAFAKSRS